MKRIFMCLLALALIAPVACSSSGSTTTGGRTAESETRDWQEAHAIPDWVISLRGEDSNAFYGVGVGSYRSATNMQLGFTAAEAAARRQIADTLEVTIQAALQRYMEQVVTPEGDVVEESLTRDVMRSVTNETIRGVTIDKRQVVRDRETGLYIVFVLAKIGGEAVAEQIREETNRQVGQVRQRAEAAFEQLDDILNQEIERNRPAQAEYEDVPANARNPERYEPVQQ